MNTKLLLALTLSLTLSACIEGKNTPKQVAQKYWDALQKGDHETARQLTSKESQQELDEYLTLPPEQKTTLDIIELGTQQAVVNTVIYPREEAPDSHHNIETVLVLENGDWKVDASRTQPPPPKTPTEQELEELAQQLSESMQDNIDSMDGALTEGMKMLNEALRDGSKEMGESMLKLMDDLNKSMKQSIDKMKQRNQHKKQEEPKDELQPDPNRGEGMI